jgi:predicted AAA+ superfamily ATPase
MVAQKRGALLKSAVHCVPASPTTKFYLFDAGIFNSLMARAALEGLVAQHLWAWSAYLLEPHTATFWRTQSGLEVDFIVHGSNLFVAIEVKHSRLLDCFRSQRITCVRQGVSRSAAFLFVSR